MKKFTDKIKESKEYSTIHSMTNDQLEERLEFLRLELKETQDEIHSIISVLKSRSDVNDKKEFDKLPKSIYDLDKEQIKFVLTNSNGMTSYRYKESLEYWYQLFGFHPSGTKNDQVYFNLTLSSFEENDEFRYNNDFEISFNFLKENLVDFTIGVLGMYDDHSYRLTIKVDDKINVYEQSVIISRFELDEKEKFVKFLFDRDKRYYDDDF